MARGPQIQTQRLTLRRWQKDDLKPFAALNADPIVMEHFPSVLTAEDTARFVTRIEEHFDEYGYGLWVVEHELSGDFVGFTGLFVPSFEAPFTPAVEIGWRLAAEHWGKGYATEAARGALRFGFEQAGLAEIVSFTVPANTQSTKVMERIGMTHNAADDFDHPSLPEGSPPRRHVLYRMSASDWDELNQP